MQKNKKWHSISSNDEETWRIDKFESFSEKTGVQAR